MPFPPERSGGTRCDHCDLIHEPHKATTLMTCKTIRHSTKKADAAKTLKGFNHVGLLYNEPPSDAGMLFIKSSDNDVSFEERPFQIHRLSPGSIIRLPIPKANGFFGSRVVALALLVKKVRLIIRFTPCDSRSLPVFIRRRTAEENFADGRLGGVIRVGGQGEQVGIAESDGAGSQAYGDRGYLEQSVTTLRCPISRSAGLLPGAEQIAPRPLRDPRSRRCVES
jgi:hypothetical protein